MESTTGTFLVTHTDDDSGILQDIHSRQVYPLAECDSLAEGELIEGTITPQPPLEVAWQIEHVTRQYAVDIVVQSDSPSDQAVDLAGRTEPGDLAREPLASGGELHVLVVDPDQVDEAIDDVRDDLETVARAARLGADRVELRAGDGFLSVRYLV